jgi:hypothetical protein
MSKAFVDPRLKNQKCYVASRNIQRPLVRAGSFSIELMLDEEYMIGDLKPIVDRKYDTRYLGQGHYRLFKIYNDKP